MSATQVMVHEEIELQTPKLAPSTSRTFGVDSAAPTPADSTTHLARSRDGQDIKESKDSKGTQDEESGDEAMIGDEAPREGAVEVAPEGGYGWVIVAICSLAKWVLISALPSCFFHAGSTYSFGVIQAALVQEGLAPPSTLAFVGSLANACLSIFAIPNSNLIKRYGAKKVLMSGLTIKGVSEIIASFTTTNVAGLFVTSGLLTGLGFSMIYMPVATLPNQYFVRKSGLANGIVQACGGLGGGVVALLLGYLITKVGIAWCLRILGLLTLCCAVPAAYFVKERSGRKSAATIEWRLFKDIRFTTIFIASAIATLPLMVPPFFLPLYGSQFGLSTMSSAALVSGFNLASALGRVLFGQLADWIGPVNALIIAMLSNGFALLVLWPVSMSLAPLIIFVIVSGIAAGAFFSLMPTTVASLTDPTIMTSGYGLFVTGWGAGYLLGPPIAGYLLQASGGADAGISAYRPAMYYAGSLTVASVLMIIGMKLKTTKSIRKRM